MTETITQRIAHLEAARSWQPGDRVRVIISGRTGTLVKRLGRHNGWKVRWDEPVFGVGEGNVQIPQLERI